MVVAPNRIGAINQTLQTLITAATFQEGLPVAGVVLNDVEPNPADVSQNSNASELAGRMVPPLLAHVGYEDAELPQSVDWMALARGGPS